MAFAREENLFVSRSDPLCNDEQLFNRLREGHFRSRIQCTVREFNMLSPLSSNSFLYADNVLIRPASFASTLLRICSPSHVIFELFPIQVKLSPPNRALHSSLGSLWFDSVTKMWQRSPLLCGCDWEVRHFQTLELYLHIMNHISTCLATSPRTTYNKNTQLK